MTVLVVGGGLTFIVVLLILLPLPVKDGRLRVRAHSADDVRRRELLRQLRDLDDDLAAGKLTKDDHIRLREPVEREAIAVLSRPTHGTASSTGRTTSGKWSRSATKPPERGATRWWAQPWRRRGVTLLGTAGAASVIVLLISAVSARHAGQTITGNSVPGAISVAGNSARSGPASHPGQKSPTSAQLAAVAAAEAAVKRDPKDVSAHLDLADAYAAAGASQLAAVEYLAVIRLAPANAEANTSLALLVFEVGQAAQGKAMVDRVLAANPKYPEAWYVRGLIDLIGLRQPADAARDFDAYLAAAPFGSHRTAAVTLLALAQSQVHR